MNFIYQELQYPIGYKTKIHKLKKAANLNKDESRGSMNTVAKRIDPQEWRIRLLHLDNELKRKKGPSWKEECHLCHRIFSFQVLQRCGKCGKLYCSNCLTDGLTEDNGIICLSCARRLVSPRKKISKYSPLGNFLAYKAQYTTVTTLPFARIEGIISDNLPLSALRHRSWWSNSQKKAWKAVGWEVLDVDLKNRTVTFRRPNGLLEKQRKKRKKITEFVLPTKPKTRRRPSKTKIARAQARLKNIERKRNSMRRYRGRFKPKSAFEKRLYLPEAKP